MIDYLKRRNFTFGGYRMDCDCAKPPDYTSLANASKESAEIMAKLGYAQLDESKRQYDINRGVVDPIIKAQTGLMEQTKTQGDDYYKYLVDTYRPIEQGLAQEAADFSTAGAREGFARKAAADLEMQQANEQAQSDRAMAAMGVNPNSGRFAGMRRGSNILNAAQRAGATTNARTTADNLAWAKRMDVTGLGRNLPGASAASYSLAMQSGNSAAGNQMGLGNQLLTGMNQGNATIGSGQNMQLQGLSSILGAQTSYANAMNANSGDGGLMGALGTIGGAAITTMSDRRLKEDIVPVGVDERTGLTIYEFGYKGDPEERRYRGVMADEVDEIAPHAVFFDKNGFASVDYGAIGIEFKEV